MMKPFPQKFSNQSMRKPAPLSWILISLLALTFSACASGPEPKIIRGDLQKLTDAKSVAILPVETTASGQKSTASLFRRSLYANLKKADLQLMERYVIDGILQQNKLTDPARLRELGPQKLGELLGADAVVFSRINKVNRLYLLVHSSIEVGATVDMYDARTGETLWSQTQSESDYSGLAKIPTGMFSAAVSPVLFVTNKLNLNKMTSSMTNKMASLWKLDKKSGDKLSNFKAKKSAPVIQRVHRFVESKHSALQPMQVSTDGARSAIRLAEAKFNPEANKRTPIYPFLTVTREDVRVEPKEPPALKAQAELGESVQVAALNIAKGGNLLETRPREIQNIMITEPEAAPSNPIPAKADQQSQPIAGETVAISWPAAPVAPLPAEDPYGKRASILYTIQVGAYKTKELATSLIGKLSRKGYQAFISPLRKGGDLLYRVRVEKLEDEGDARQLAQRLETQEQLPNFLAQIQG